MDNPRLDQQKQLLKRIQKDLRQLAEHCRGTQRPIPATDCDGQADMLEDVLKSLDQLAQMKNALLTLSTIVNQKGE